MMARALFLLSLSGAALAATAATDSSKSVEIFLNVGCSNINDIPSCHGIGTGSVTVPFDSNGQAKFKIDAKFLGNSETPTEKPGCTKQFTIKGNIDQLFYDQNDCLRDKDGNDLGQCCDTPGTSDTVKNPYYVWYGPRPSSSSSSTTTSMSASTASDDWFTATMTDGPSTSDDWGFGDPMTSDDWWSDTPFTSDDWWSTDMPTTLKTRPATTTKKASETTTTTKKASETTTTTNKGPVTITTTKTASDARSTVTVRFTTNITLKDAPPKSTMQSETKSHSSTHSSSMHQASKTASDTAPLASDSSASDFAW